MGGTIKKNQKIDRLELKKIRYFELSRSLTDPRSIKNEFENESDPA